MQGGEVAEREGVIDSSESAKIEIPARFRGIWVFDVAFCDNPEAEPATFITADGFRREEIWGEAQEILSISPDGSEMRLIMGYQYETVEMYLYDSHWALSDSGTQLSVAETNLWRGADPHENPTEFLVRCI